MSERTLARIEKTLAGLVSRQEQMCAELSALGRRVDGLAHNGAAPRGEVLSYLDQFRAAESLGESTLGAWIEVCTTECLKGGLRTVQQREGFHARLLEERLRELGGVPSFELPAELRDAAAAEIGSREKSDREKVLGFVERFGDVDATLAPIYAMIDKLDGDPETQWLLKTIAQDERSTIDFFSDARALMSA